MTMLLLLCQKQVVGSSFLNSSSRALPIQHLIIADDRLTRKCGSVSTCADFIQTERLFTIYSVTIPLLHARAKNIYELAAGSAHSDRDVTLSDQRAEQGFCFLQIVCV
jgi:hypothetical protein